MSIQGMLGIDVSKEDLVYAFMRTGTQKPAWEKTVPNTAAGIAKIMRQTPPGTPWVVEPTGRYSIPLVERGLEAGMPVLMAPPRKAKAFLASLPQRAKTDRLDSRGLALFGLTRQATQPLLAYPIKSKEVQHLDQLLSARKGLSRALSSLRQQQSELPYAREALEAAANALAAQIKKLDKQIAALVAQTPQFCVAAEIDRVHGIGTVTAAAVASRLSAKGFAHPDQFVAYIGMDLDVRDSGKRKGQRALTKQGDAELRRLLYLCAQASIRAKGSPFKAQYERELAKGYTKTAALCAVARKMARLCWSLHKHGSRYDPDRVYTAPAACRRSEASDPAPAPAVTPGDTE